MTIQLSQVLKQVKNSEYIVDPASEKYVTVSGHGKGVSERVIKDGKTPVPFNAYRIEKGQLIYSRIGADDGAFGIVPEELDKAVVSKDFPVFEINQEIANKDYLIYFLTSDAFCRKAKRESFGATMTRFREEKLLSCLMELPKIDEQERIVKKLRKIQAIIDYRLDELMKLDNLIKARFVEVFGDPKSNPYGYPVHELSEYIEFLTSGSRGWAKYCVDDGDEWFITIKNVKDCHISTDNMQPVAAPDNAEAKRTKVKEGDLLISITADLGRTGVVTKEIAEHGSYINQHLTCIRLNQEVLEPLYVAYYMESAAGKEQFVSKNQSAVKAGLNFNSINTLRLLVPPRENQRDFLSFVKQVDKSKVAVQKSLDEAQLLFDSLMQEYFG